MQTFEYKEGMTWSWNVMTYTAAELLHVHRSHLHPESSSSRWGNKEEVEETGGERG